MGKIVKNGVTYSGSSDNADNVKYNNNASNLDATNVQEAIDKLDESVDTLNSNLTNVISLDGNPIPFGADAKWKLKIIRQSLISDANIQQSKLISKQKLNN